MKTDLYIKTILTIIALFLGVLAFDKVYNAVVPEAQASGNQWTCSSSRWESLGLRSPRTPDRVAYEKKWTFMTTPIEVKKGSGVWMVCGRP